MIRAPPRQAIVDQGDSGCEAAQLGVYRGSFPKDPKTLAIRWTGYTNYELAYQWPDHSARRSFRSRQHVPPLGFTAADVKRANVILLGHGHLDHMSDAASVGARTGAMVVGAPVTTDKLKTQSIDPSRYGP